MINIENLSKKYVNFEALKTTTMKLERGKIVGILGPNGSGKTTLLRILASELMPNTGSFGFDGKKFTPQDKARISALTSPDFLPRWMSIKDAKNHYRDFYKDFDTEKFSRLLDFLELREDMDVSSLSKGMRSKLNLALTISRNSELIILDEPLDGVDPVAREEILEMIIRTFNGESTMLITSHLINELERLLDEVYFIRNGVVKYMGEAETLRAENSQSLDELYRDVYKTERNYGI